jgi:hypothetical protein
LVSRWHRKPVPLSRLLLHWRCMGVEWNWNAVRRCTVRKLIRLWKERDYHSVYEILKTKEYDYTIDNLEKDFAKVSSTDKFCYLLYLLSRDYSVKNTLLLCDFLMYIDPFFYDIHPVIQMFIRRALELFPKEPTLLEWVVSTYETHPDSPFKEAEMITFKEQQSKLI